MTAVTVGDATKAEPTAVRERVHAAVRHREDGRAMMVATTRGPLPTLVSCDLLGSLERMAAPVDGDQHMTADRGVGVRYQESPAEPDVSGTIPAFRGRTPTAEATGKHNVGIIRRLKADAAAKALDALLTVEVGEAEGVPQGAGEVAGARNEGRHSYGTRYY